MSKLNSLDFPSTSPLSSSRLSQKIQTRDGFQAAAASLAAQYIMQMDHTGQLGDATLLVGAVPGAGESMTVDVLKNGVSIMLSGALTVNVALIAAPGAIDLFSLFDKSKITYVVGDVFTTTRVYTAGATPAPMSATDVILEACPDGLVGTRVQTG